MKGVDPDLTVWFSLCSTRFAWISMCSTSVCWVISLFYQSLLGSLHVLIIFSGFSFNVLQISVRFSTRSPVSTGFSPGHPVTAWFHFGFTSICWVHFRLSTVCWVPITLSQYHLGSHWALPVSAQFSPCSSRVSQLPLQLP